MHVNGVNMAAMALVAISSLAPVASAVWTCPSEREAYCCTHYEDKATKGLFGTGCTPKKPSWFGLDGVSSFNTTTPKATQADIMNWI